MNALQRNKYLQINEFQAYERHSDYKEALFWFMNHGAKRSADESNQLSS